MRILLLLLFVLLISGCDFGNTICPAVDNPSLVVEVHDAEAGEPAAYNTLGIARDGAFADTLQGGEQPDDVMLTGPLERPGTYAITIEKAGYRLWHRDGISVRSGECGVRTVRLEALLERE